MAAGDHTGRVVLAGNRTGKSEQGAYECNLAIQNEHPCRQFPKSGIGWVVGLDFTMIDSVDLPLFQKFMPREVRSMSRWRAQSKVWEIRTPKGGEWLIYFKSTDSGTEKFQSAKVDWIWFDEEPKKTNIFSECETRLIDNDGVWWMSATPIRGTKWLKDLSLRKDVYSCTGGMLDNPYLPKDKVLAFGETLTPEEYDVRILGLYVLFGGKPVFEIRELNRLMDIVRKEIPAEEGWLYAV